MPDRPVRRRPPLPRWPAVALLLLACGGVDEARQADDWQVRDPGRDAGTVLLDAAVDGPPGDALPVLDAQSPDALPVLDAEPLDDARSDGGPIDAAAPDAGPDMAVDLGPDAGPPAGCPEGMVLVPAGDFPFGPRGDLRFLPAFCVDVTEVSAGAYLDCVADGACDGYEEWGLCRDEDPRRPHQCRPDMLDHPANWIDWYRAEQYCRWAGKRLPDEGQWEKAATGVDGRMYPWGNGINCRDAHVERGEPFDTCLGVDGLPDLPVAVDAYADNPGPYGALNMVGNVREWLDLRVDREVLPDEDEIGIAKGGDWRASFDQVMNTDRDGTLAVSRSSRGHGFRCVLDL